MFAGPNATVLNTPPLVSGGGRSERGDRTEQGAGENRPVLLRPQRLAAPVTVLVEQFSAHPLEADARDLYDRPDVWIDAAGELHDEPIPGGVGAYRVVLRPEDGLYLLPYVAAQSDGSPWEDAAAFPGAPRASSRQTFFPDASRLYEEIDRFGIRYDGRGEVIATRADFDFFRAAPSGGWTKGDGTSRPEVDGEDFFAYFPYHLHTEPSTVDLVRITNEVQRVLGSDRYVGAQWLENSPTIEETLYWLSLTIDTTIPIVGQSAQRPHLSIGADGDRNIADGVEFILSRAWADDVGVNALGAVLVADELVFSAREVAKTDARPGNHVAVGHHGGVVASFGGDGSIHPTFLPVRRHTHCSALRVTELPDVVPGVRQHDGRVEVVDVPIRPAPDALHPEAIPRVTIHTYGRFQSRVSSGSAEPALDAVIRDGLERFPLSGLVGEGTSPYVSMNPSTDQAFYRAVLSGFPVVKVGRGHPGGDAHRRDPMFIAGNDLTATKARILLMAALMKFGAIPPAADRSDPTPGELAAARAHVARFQEVFDTH